MSGMRSEIKTRIRHYIRETFLLDDSAAAIPDDASLLELGVVDSTGILDLVLFVEEQFGIQVGDDELVPANFETVDRLAAYIASKDSSHLFIPSALH
jgi:acyl carrier protein